MTRALALVCLMLLVMGLPGPGRAHAGACKGWLSIPAIDLEVCIVTVPLERGEWHTEGLRDYAGWLEQTAWIHDATWRVVLTGHTPGLFGRLNQLEVGAIIVVTDDGGSVPYRVTGSLVTTPQDVQWVAPTAIHTLTLITCTDGIELRVIVNAERITRPPDDLMGRPDERATNTSISSTAPR